MWSKAPKGRSLVLALAAAAATLLAGAASAQEPDLAARFKALGLTRAEARSWFHASSPDVMSVLPGRDPGLRNEYVLVSAPHGEAGDAALLALAQRLRSDGGLRRPVLFAALAPEGADGFSAVRRALPRGAVAVAEVSLAAEAAGGGALVVRGLEDTSLGLIAATEAAGFGATVTSESLDRALAERVSEAETPLIAVGLPQAQSPGVAVVERLVRVVANQRGRPLWLPGSRFAPPTPRAERDLTAPVDYPVGRRKTAPAAGLG